MMEPQIQVTAFIYLPNYSEGCPSVYQAFLVSGEFKVPIVVRKLDLDREGAMGGGWRGVVGPATDVAYHKLMDQSETAKTGEINELKPWRSKFPELREKAWSLASSAFELALVQENVVHA